MRRVITILSAALALLIVTGLILVAAGCGSGVPEDAVATVGDVSVSKARLQELMKQAETQMESYGYSFPEEGTDTYDQYVAQMVDYLVQAEVVVQGAATLDLSVTDEEIDAEVTEIEETYGGEEEVLALLEEQGMTLALLKFSIKNQLLSQKVAEVVTKDASVTTEEIRAYWDAHKKQLKKKKATKTLAKATKTIKSKLLENKEESLWNAWLEKKTAEFEVRYAAGYDPSELTASPSASPTG